MTIWSSGLSKQFDFLRALAVVAAMGVAISSTSSSIAQENEQNTGPALTVSPLTGQPLNEWVKVCEKDAETQRDVCVTTFELRDQRGGFLATVGARRFVEGDPGDLLVISVPPGMLLQPGFRVRIDEEEPIAGVFTLCVPQRCFGQLSARETSLFDKMKAGTALMLFTIAQTRQTVPFPISLSGFTAAFDGEPTDISQLNENRDELRDTLRARAEAARQRLLQQKQQNQ